MIIKNISQDELKNKFIYNTDTGVFKWLITSSNKVKIGDIAGGLDGRGYISIKINGKAYKCHRLAWLYVYGSFPNKDLDHINGNKIDNRFCNLREATNTQNNYNTGMLPANTSGIKGVRFNNKVGKWQAQASVNGKNKHLGFFINAELAKEAYANFVKVLHGEYLHPTI